MVRPAASLLLAGAVAVSPAMAAERALIDYLGYSDDGRYFAFEEYGVQDGSGFPYSNIYIVDLDTDSWVNGTPVRVRLDGEGADAADAREQALDDIRPVLDELGVGGAVQQLAVIADGDPRADDATELSFGDPGYGLDEVRNPRTLTLEIFALEPGADCAIIDDAVFGFALQLDGIDVHRDDALPASRGCVMGYKIHAVVRPADWSGNPGKAVAIVSSYPYGFEGPDRRFLAVPLPE